MPPPPQAPDPDLYHFPKKMVSSLNLPSNLWLWLLGVWSDISTADDPVVVITVHPHGQGVLVHLPLGLSSQLYAPAPVRLGTVY